MAHASQDKHFGPLGSCFAALTPCFEHVVAHKKYLQTKCGKLGEKKSKKKKETATKVEPTPWHSNTHRYVQKLLKSPNK